MSLLKAISKAVLRSVNEYAYSLDKKHAKQKAFNSVGLFINNAKKNGHYVNGRNAFNKQLNLQTLKAKRRFLKRNDFINDL